MGYCSYCGNWVEEGSICECCGSAGGSYDSFEMRKMKKFTIISKVTNTFTGKAGHAP